MVCHKWILEKMEKPPAIIATCNLVSRGCWINRGSFSQDLLHRIGLTKWTVLLGHG